MDELERSPRLEKLKQRLQRREGSGFTFRRTPLDAEVKVPHKQWENTSPIGTTARQKTSSWLKMLLFLSIGFFVVAIAVAGFVLFQGSNVISNKNIAIEIRGPLGVKAGNAVDLEIVLNNKNRADLEAVDMVIEYPDGTRQVENISTPLTRTREMVGTIAAGQSVSRFEKAVFFGEENIAKRVRVSIEYRVSDSNALFEKEAWYDFKVNAAPLNVVADFPQEINSGQEVVLKVKAVSNSDAPLENVLVAVKYPTGFHYTDSSLRPAFNTLNTWDFGTIAAGEQRSLEIRGTLEGKSHAGKTFEIQSGIARTEEPQTFNIVYVTTPVTIAIKESFFNPQIVINENASEEDRILPGNVSQVTVNLNWENTVGAPLADGQLIATLNGRVIDKASVSSEGFYRSSADSISWNGKLLPSLASMAAGEKGATSFNFKILPLVSADGKTFTNPVIEIKADLRASRISAGFAHEEVKSTVTRRIKLSSLIGFTTTLFQRQGPIENTGPLPPVVDKTTKYSIVWSVSNSSNDLKAASIRTTLPLYIEWTGITTPAAEKISYNPRTREVVWDLGSVTAGTGIGGRERKAAFQVSFTPSLTQIEISPRIMEDPVFVGTDTFTGVVLSDKKEGITIVPEGDTGAKHEDGVVVGQ